VPDKENRKKRTGLFILIFLWWQHKDRE